ncbi:II-FBPL [Triplophysa rosa]|uniref:II-FBPL n=1 Tax=Triplophysa rosa TaxID=992332 RepID=A0A9W7X434_TRIRA|nr:II-FBPL [Triplophysa rosa]
MEMQAGLVCIPASSGENLALKGTVTQSSTYLTHGAQYAIDGERYRDEFCSTTAKENNPWWKLDLLNVYNISRVIITAHGSSLEETSGAAEIRIGNSLIKNPTCAVTSGLLLGHTISYSCGVMEGRYVNLFIPGSIVLSLCEVEVYGKFLGQRTKTFLRLKFSSSGDVAAESDDILHQLQSALASHISDLKVSWTQHPKKEEEKEEEDTRSCD